jgi:hypothetical protein
MPVAAAFRPNRSLQVFFCLGCIAIALFYGWSVTRAYLASRLASPPAELSLQRAMALEPENALYPYTLGQYLMLGVQRIDGAVAPLQRATELNPHNSTYWLDLALAYYLAGDTRHQRQALESAIAVDPTSPVVAWNAANFFLVQGDVSAALRQFLVVLKYDPGQVRPALDLCWRALHDPAAIINILPPDPEVYLQLVKLLSERHEADAAYSVWSALWQLNLPFDYRHAMFYVDDLIQQRNVARAAEVWKQITSRSLTLSRYATNDNLVGDSKFSEEILNGGFGWRFDARPGVAVSLDTAQFHSGTRSVMVDYSDRGDDVGLYQYVPVQPHTRYVLSAWVKSEDLETANGPRIAAFDVYDNTTLATAEETVGTTEWHRVEVPFETGPATELIAVRFIRNPGTTLIHGQFWIDEVAVTPADSSPAK